MKKLELIRDLCVSRVKELGELQEKVDRSLRRAPKGRLVLSVSNQTVQYYHKTRPEESKGTYIRKNHQKLIHALAQKDYDMELKGEIEKQKMDLERILECLPTKEIDSLYEGLNANRKNLVMSHMTSDKEYAEEWLQVEYAENLFYESGVVHTTERGEKVRSKSEKILADKLYSMGIPYRYECPLYLEGYGTVYPDFTLLDMSDRQEIYLEHFGMMDDPEYSQKTVMKLQAYARSGIYPGQRLLMTFETLQTPLDMKIVEEMLRERLSRIRDSFIR